MGSNGKKIKQLRKRLKQSASYRNWLEIAQELDGLEGKDDWRMQDESKYYHYRLIRKHLTQMRQYRASNSLKKLVDILHESLYRHLGELSNPALYRYSRADTKHVISEYLEEAIISIKHICDHEIPGIPQDQKLRLFEQADHNFGRTALMLSGGGAFGIYHTGVAKALWEQRLLPDIVSGSSMGSIVAAGVCSRDDEELDYFFAHPESIHREALRLLDFREIWQTKMIMNPKQLEEHITANVGDFTFLETFEHSGRILNITVSPTRSQQKPRVLNYMTAPNLTVVHSAIASCAIPGVFPPVSLLARDSSGKCVPYMSGEKWIDGSVHGVLPM